MARGLKAWVSDINNSAAIGAGGAVMLTAPNIDFDDGRAFEFGYGARWTGSVANTNVVRFQRTNLAGAQILADFSDPCNVTPATYEGHNVAVNTSGGVLTQTVVLTMGATAGTIVMNGAVRNPRYMYIRDVGAAGDYPNAPQI
jgi:hypothetical protein